MGNKTQKLNQSVEIIQREIKGRVEQLGPVRDALINGKVKVDDIGYLSSGQRSAVLLAARLEQELENPLFTFLRLDDDLQAFVLLSRERPDLIGSIIANIF